MLQDGKITARELNSSKFGNARTYGGSSLSHAEPLLEAHNVRIYRGRIPSSGNQVQVMTPLFSSWQFWAILSACFAALTAIFAKIGVEDINPDFATLVRTIVILAVVSLILSATGAWQNPRGVAPRTYVFLLLSGAATGMSWLCYFRALKIGDAARVAPIDKLSVVLVALFGVVFLGERMAFSGWLGVALIASGAILVAYRI